MRRVLVVLLILAAGCGGVTPGETPGGKAPRNDGANHSFRGVELRNVFILGGERGQQVPAGASVPLYFTLINKRSNPDRLQVVAAPGTARSVRLPPRGFDIAAGQVLLGGPVPQVVLDGTVGPLRHGSYVDVVFQFQDAGVVTLNVPVIARVNEYATYSLAPTPTPTPKVTPRPTAR